MERACILIILLGVDVLNARFIFFCVYKKMPVSFMNKANAWKGLLIRSFEAVSEKLLSFERIWVDENAFF